MTPGEITVVLRHRAGAFALDAAFIVPARGICGIFGPSGAGKTTLLRCIAGLTRGQGHVRVGEVTWQDDAQRICVPTHARGVGYVAQDPALFPHLSVRENILYGHRRVPRGETPLTEADVIEWLRIAPLLARMPGMLSGGERQRVAIARALLSAPRLLLLDEPVSALDEAGRAEVLPCLARLHRELTIPVLLVTHTLAELARFADTIVHLQQGSVAASGGLTDMLPRLGTPGDALAVLRGVVREVDARDHLMSVDTAFGPLWCAAAAQPGEEVRLLIAAREVSLGREVDPGSSILNQVPAIVDTITEVGPGQCIVRLRPPLVNADALLALITARSCRQLGLTPGAPIIARVKGANVGAA